ncbi:MAG TPA: TonB-dependent receptor [Thermoanaerobaculia bacterium]
MGWALVACLLGSPALARTQEPQAEPSELTQLSIEELMQIDVTSVSRRTERVFGAAAAVSVITGEEIRRSGATSLPDALRLIAALHVAQVNGYTWAVSARGFNLSSANKLLVLIDGRSIYTPLFSGVFWESQDVFLEDIDRIEVIRGPGAALWGANAVNGVINILTRSAQATQGGLASAGAGNETRALGSFRHGGTIREGTYYRAYGKYTYQDALALPGGGGGRDPLRRGQAGFRVDQEDRGAGAFTFQGDVYRGVASDLVRADTELEGGNILGRWSRSLSEASDLELQVYYDVTDRLTPNFFGERRDTFDIDFQHRHNFNSRHDLIWGGGYRVSRDDVMNSREVAFLPAEDTQELFSAFVQDEIVINPRLRMILGSKFEHQETTGFEVQPSARFAWTPTERRTIWGAVSRAVRTPTRLDQDIRFFTPTGETLVRGDEDFQSEELIAYELGYRIQPRPEVFLDAAVFYHDYDQLRSQERSPTPTGLPIVLGNALNAETWGLEVRAQYEPIPHWRLHAGYALFEKDLSLDPGSTDPTGGAGEGNDPRHRFTLRSYVDLPGRFELDGMVRYVSRLPRPVVPSYTALDLRLGWRASDRLNLSLVGQNLLDESHPEFGAPTPRRVEIERGFYGRATWRF